MKTLRWWKRTYEKALEYEHALGKHTVYYRIFVVTLLNVLFSNAYMYLTLTLLGFPSMASALASVEVMPMLSLAILTLFVVFILLGYEILYVTIPTLAFLGKFGKSWEEDLALIDSSIKWLIDVQGLKDPYQISSELLRFDPNTKAFHGKFRMSHGYMKRLMRLSESYNEDIAGILDLGTELVEFHYEAGQRQTEHLLTLNDTKKSNSKGK